MALKILLTNDDGIDAEGLRIVLGYIKDFGDITVVAPKVQQSGKSQAIELHKPYEVKKVELNDASRAYYVDSTPADCVRFAILGLKERYDLVISGCNKGYNIGDDISYSGTVGAIFEAARHNHKAIALSTDYYTFEGAEKYIKETFEFIENNKLLEEADLLNVNFPKESKGIRITKQGYPMYSDDFVCVGNDMYEPSLRTNYIDGKDLDIDTDCVMNGYVSITPLQRDHTDRDLYHKLKAINKDDEAHIIKDNIVITKEGMSR